MRGRTVMRHSLHNPRIQTESRLDKVLSVPGRAAADEIQLGTGPGTFRPELFKPGLDGPDRIAPVRAII